MKSSLLLFSFAFAAMTASADSGQIRISTDHTDLILHVNSDQRLVQQYLGRRLRNEADLHWLKDGREVYLTHGMEDYFEPALELHHADGNPSTLLRYTGHTTSTTADGATETVITLTDDKYPTTVRLHYAAYAKEDVVKTWTEISNGEKKPVELVRYASSLLHADADRYYLTQFSGDWADEVHMATEELHFGKKQLDTKLGTRANMFTPPMFILSLDEPARENAGDCILGQLGWTGNFRFTFEVDNKGGLRVISGINPYFSERSLKSGETFTTPEFYYTYSSEGLNRASQNLHNWARNLQLKDGRGSRLTLLNNWEATYFDFDEEKLCGLMGDAVKLGVDMFLLDDGWFGNKHPRHSDTQGLGDWQETQAKLPNGVGRLCEEAKKKGIRFGIWIEPEMVNPKSELYEQHKDWVIHLPNRDEYYFRNQMVLDLSNPEVQEFVFNVVDNLMTKYPEIAFFKWDCNSPITNIFSPYLEKQKAAKGSTASQQNLYVDYVLGLYSVLERIKAKYPTLPMMLCSGGSGRIDYKALSYFTEFWASDNTDPVERLFIQYAYSYFYPAKATCAHVTTWNKDASLKFKTDVASMGKLGFDIKLTDMTADEVTYANGAVKNYRRLQPIIGDGDMYRLVSPYNVDPFGASNDATLQGAPHAATQFVSKDKNAAVLFTFDIYPRYADRTKYVKLQGLDPKKTYSVEEINLMPGQDTWVKNRTYTGDFLMTVGLDLFTTNKLNSRVVELRAVK